MNTTALRQAQLLSESAHKNIQLGNKLLASWMASSAEVMRQRHIDAQRKIDRYLDTIEDTRNNDPDNRTFRTYIGTRKCEEPVYFNDEMCGYREWGEDVYALSHVPESYRHDWNRYMNEEEY